MSTKAESLPKTFVWRRLHSLAGIWLVLFLIEHLITNSQAALLLGENGQSFIRMVNLIHNLPYLGAIEVALLGIPFLIHMIWGVRYALTTKPNVRKSDGSSPSLPLSRNRAYTWQRITSWILLVLLIVHVVKFRFVEYPDKIQMGASTIFCVKIEKDPGIYTVADRLGVKLYDEKALAALPSFSSQKLPIKESYTQEEIDQLLSTQKQSQVANLNQHLSSFSLKPSQLLATSPSFGTASLLTVRDTFKNPWWVAIYTVFVLSASFHAFNGLWTSMLTWGWIVKATLQTKARKVAFGLMLMIAFLGLCSVWGTYFLNLRV